MSVSAMKPIEILLVEDNPGDARLTREALALTRIRNNLHITRDGEEAMAFLRNEAPFQRAPAPDLVLLDLNLPRRDGREVLEDIKKDPQLQHIPVVVLTSSQAEEDILRTHRLHANCFITKPTDLEHLPKVVQGIEQFWFALVRLRPEA
jgi:chemotaxis family two-component system response regulator Rcp1